MYEVCVVRFFNAYNISAVLIKCDTIDNDNECLHDWPIEWCLLALFFLNYFFTCFVKKIFKILSLKPWVV